MAPKDTSTISFVESKIVESTLNSPLKIPKDAIRISLRASTRRIRCVTVGGLIILKFYALLSLYRQGKFDRVSIYENDILLLMLQYPLDIEAVFQILSNSLLPSDLEQVKEIATDIQSRVKGFASQKKKLEEGQ